MTSILVVIGTRPEAIKLAPVIRALRAVASVRVVRTGQQSALADAMLRELDIVPDVALPQVPNPYTLAELTAVTLRDVDAVLAQVQPDWVVVQGDTNSAAAAALAAFYRGIRVGHVEAGLRTHDLADPFPEEGNRRLIGSLATLHFAPTPRAAQNLADEGVPAERVRMTGNTIVDAVNALRRGWSEADRAEMAQRLGFADRPVVLVTTHRRENQGLALRSICAAIRTLAQRYPQVLWLVPMHPNPALRDSLERELGGLPNLVLREPLDYRDTLLVIEHCVLVVTDSGGLQEEVAAFGRPTVVLRERTERPEIVEAGLAVLAGHNTERIIAAVSRRLDAVTPPALAAGTTNPFGDGHAAERIAAALTGTESPR